jgi:hypothetical protein
MFLHLAESVILKNKDKIQPILKESIISLFNEKALKTNGIYFIYLFSKLNTFRSFPYFWKFRKYRKSFKEI